MSLRDQIKEIDGGRFIALVNAMPAISDDCGKCSHLRPELPPGHGYRCRSAPGCPAATLHPELQSYWRWKLGWQTYDEHLKFLGLLRP